MSDTTRQMWICVLSGAVLFALGSPARAEDRSYDGGGNNLMHEDWGAVGQMLTRLAPSNYADGISTPMSGLPSAREVSNVVGRQTGLVGNERRLSGYVYAFGQFLTHEVERVASGSELMFIPSLPSDPQFHGRTLFLPRSMAAPSTGIPGTPLEQLNLNTSFLDASVVYGSDANRAQKLRVATAAGPGARLLTSGAQNLLPRNTLGLVNDDGGTGTAQSNLFVAGDVRANENVALSTLHTLFMREHNRLVDVFAAAHPSWSQEELYQRARKTVGAELQVITYQEFLPALLGPHALDPHGQYDSTLNPATINEFATAFFRVGHSMLPSTFRRVREDGTPAPGDPVPVGNDAFRTSAYLRSGEELEHHLRGLSVELQEEVDPMVVNNLRNIVVPGVIDIDLLAGDIQRGRDHGLADYNTLRAGYGLAGVESFGDITGDTSLQAKLAQLYGNLDSLEPFVGALAEGHLPGASVGPLTAAVVNEQFRRLRDGDRFWYENDPAFTAEEIATLESTRLSDIIRRNTTIANLQDNVFFLRPVIAPSAWNIDTEGNWSDGGNWTNVVPNAAGASAEFGRIVTVSRTVTVDVPITVGRIDFDNANAYTIAGPQILTLDPMSGDAQINVASGSHTITAPVTLADDTLVNVMPAAANLSITGTLTAGGQTLNKVGSGTLTVNNVRSLGLAIYAGDVTIAPNGTTGSTSTLGTLAIAGATDAWTAKLDLANNDAVVQSSAANKTADFGRLQNQLKQGFNNGTWTGLGITSATAAANTSADTGLAVVDNALLGLSNFSGQSVSADSILLKYTYYGDIDQNGQVDADDLTVFASNFGRAAGATQIDGDIDFNGAVNADDLTVFANNFNKGVGNPLAAASVQAVPEPGTLVLAALGAAMVFVRVRARRHSCERG